MDNLLVGLTFSDEEKKNCLSLAHRLIRLAESAQENGIISLENEISPLEKNTYLDIGISSISGGVSAYLIEKSFLYSFVTNKSTSEELLKRLLISTSVLAIQGQNGAYGVAHLLAALLGEEYLPEFLECATKKINEDECIDSHTQYIPESMAFEKKLLSIPTADLSSLFMPFNYGTLAGAFQGCSKSFINSMRESISHNRFNQICKSFAVYQRDKKTMLEEQELILNSLAQLEEDNLHL